MNPASPGDGPAGTGPSPEGPAARPVRGAGARCPGDGVAREAAPGGRFVGQGEVEASCPVLVGGPRLSA